MSAARELRFGIFGTFDVENYGDLLFPLIAEAELTRRLGPLTLRKFSYHEKSPPSWPFSVTSLTRLPDEVVNLDGVIIGGGHVIRFDKRIAPGYQPPAQGIHHPTGYWLTPALVALNSGIPVVWNAPGVHQDTPSWAEPLLQLAINNSDYVSVRDERSRQALVRSGVNAEIQVVPDTAFGIAQLVDVQQPSAPFTRLREQLGLMGPYVVLQASASLGSFARFVRDNPAAFRGYRFLALPVSPVHRDDDTVFESDLPSMIRLPFWPDPLLLAELIAHASAVVGFSLHLSISALAFGVPLFRPANSFGGKYGIVSQFDGVYRLEDNGGVDASTFRAALARVRQNPAVAAQLQRLSEHWDVMALRLAAGKKPTSFAAANAFWARIPGLLEVTPPLGIALMKEGAGLLKQLAARPEQILPVYRSASRKISTPLRSAAQAWRRKAAR